MEFPDLGKHCSQTECNRLDFLPMKCDSCAEVFCSLHFNYERHSCTGARKDVQVPICPLCGEPVPTAPGVAPDLTVGLHIDQQCKSDTKKIFTNRCTFTGCKKKELIPVKCSQCKQNYCLRHRHTADHNCRALPSGSAASRAVNQTVFPQSNEDEQRKLAAQAAEYRRSHKPTSLFNAKPKTNIVTAGTGAKQRSPAAQVQSVQGNMTEDEALARALALSIMEFDANAEADRQRQRNEAAAAATGRRNTSVPVGGQTGQQANSKDKCSLS